MMIPEYKNTKQVSQLLGIGLSRLQKALWLEDFEPLPRRGPDSRTFLWTTEDILRAAQHFDVSDRIRILSELRGRA